MLLGASSEGTSLLLSSSATSAALPSRCRCEISSLPSATGDVTGRIDAFDASVFTGAVTVDNGTFFLRGVPTVAF